MYDSCAAFVDVRIFIAGDECEEYGECDEFCGHFQGGLF